MRRREVPTDTAGLRAAMAERCQQRAVSTRDPDLAYHWWAQAARWRSATPVVVHLWQLPPPWRPAGAHDDGRHFEVDAAGGLTLLVADRRGAELRWLADNAEPDPRLPPVSG